MNYKFIPGIILCLMLSAKGYSQPTDNIVAYYAFSGDANDGTRNAKNATISGATLTADRLGKANSAYSFDGSSSLIYLPTNLLPASSTDLCLSFWFKSYGIGNFSGQVLVDLRGQYNFAVSYFPNNPTYQRAVVLYVASSLASIDCNTPNNFIQDNIWYHVVANYGNNTMQLYINGNLVNSKTQSAPSAVSGYYNTLGKDYHGEWDNRAWFYGALDEIVIYKRSLTLTEIGALYNRGLAASETFVMNQPITFTYDETGNRTNRNIITLKSTSYIAQRDSLGLEKSYKGSSSTPGVVFEESLGEQKITIYPNPTKGVLTIEIEDYKSVAPENNSLYVYNLAGRQLLVKTRLGSSFTVDLSGYPNGIYLLKFVLGDKRSEWRVVKE
jgi:hypothetical protein